MATFNVWKSQFDPYFKNTINENDYHMLSVPNPDKPGETISWQQDFLRQIKKPTKVVNNTDVASTLETENNISSNVVKTQIDTTGGATTDVATVSASEDTVSDLPAQTMEELNEKVAQRSATEDTSTVDTSSNVGASSTVEATSSWLDKFRKTQIVPQKVITLGIEDRGNPDAEALLGAGYSLYDLPDDGTEIIKLTYDNASGTYNQVREKLSKTIKEKNDNLNTRQNQLTSALLQQPFWGLTNEVRTKLASGEIDINTFDAGLSMVPENQVKFVSMQNNLLLLNDYYTSIGEPIMPAKLVNQTVALYDMYNKKEGMVAKTATDLKALKVNSEYGGIKLTGEMIVDDLDKILKITGNIPYGTTVVDFTPTDSSSPTAGEVSLSNTIPSPGLSNNSLLTFGDINYFDFEYNSTKPTKVLPESELVRVYDKVPLKALAQEVSGNRVIYGNFVNRLDPPAFLDYNVICTTKSDFNLNNINQGVVTTTGTGNKIPSGDPISCTFSQLFTPPQGLYPGMVISSPTFGTIIPPNTVVTSVSDNGQAFSTSGVVLESSTGNVITLSSIGESIPVGAVVSGVSGIPAATTVVNFNPTVVTDGVFTPTLTLNQAATVDANDELTFTVSNPTSTADITLSNLVQFPSGTVILVFEPGGDVLNTTSIIEYPSSSVKTNRNYQVGFVLSDRYGRQSSVILSDNKQSVSSFGLDVSGSTLYSPYIPDTVTKLLNVN